MKAPHFPTLSARSCSPISMCPGIHFHGVLDVIGGNQVYCVEYAVCDVLICWGQIFKNWKSRF